ncbi:hypothetical protein H4582DRAFT_1062757 [Lactarius indigo]|nr:hypothetical protein H4582DRAFT_1062757 [Lactarius indigo]
MQFDAKSHAESSYRFNRHMLVHSACAYKSSSTIIPGRAVKSSRCSASYVGVLPSQGSHTGDAHPREPIPRNDLVDDDDAVPSTEEENAFLDSQDTGISVSDEDGVDFGIVERNGLNGPFDTSSSSVTIRHAEGFPTVTFVEERIRSWDGSGSSFKATFNRRNRTIRPGTTSTVRIEFIPEFEGQFEATLQLVFSESQLGQFAVSRRLRAIAGSAEDHQRFESLTQEGYVPRSGSGQQIPPEKIIPLPNPPQFGNLPEYELPQLVQEAVDSATSRHPYDKKAPGLIATLRPGGVNHGFLRRVLYGVVERRRGTPAVGLVSFSFSR